MLQVEALAVCDDSRQLLDNVHPSLLSTFLLSSKCRTALCVQRTRCVCWALQVGRDLHRPATPFGASSASGRMSAAASLCKRRGRSN